MCIILQTKQLEHVLTNCIFKIIETHLSLKKLNFTSLGLMVWSTFKKLVAWRPKRTQLGPLAIILEG